MKSLTVILGTIAGILLLDHLTKPKTMNGIGSVKSKTGPFGHRYTQFYHKAQEAIDFLINVQEGEAVAALYYKNAKYGMDIDIDLPWGYEGTGQSDGYGLSKIVKYHPEALDNMQSLLNGMDKVTIQKDRIILESKKIRAVIKLHYDEQAKSWLLTIYDKEQEYKKGR